MSSKNFYHNKYYSSNATIELKHTRVETTERSVLISSSEEESKDKVKYNANLNTINENNIVECNIVYSQDNFENSHSLNENINKLNYSNKILLSNDQNEERKNIIKVKNVLLRKRKGKRKPIFRIIRKRKRLLGTDNIKSKLQTYFLNFLFNFIQLILNDELFIEANFKAFKIKSEKGSLKNKTIKELLSVKNIENERNIDNIIKKVPSLEKFFNTCCLKFFHNIYYVNKHNFDLNEYGINKKITIDDELKFYDYFIEKNKTNIKDYPEYLEKIQTVIQNEFIDRIFNVNFCDKNKGNNKK